MGLTSTTGKTAETLQKSAAGYTGDVLPIDMRLFLPHRPHEGHHHHGRRQEHHASEIENQLEVSRLITTRGDRRPALLPDGAGNDRPTITWEKFARINDSFLQLPEPCGGRNLCLGRSKPRCEG